MIEAAQFRMDAPPTVAPREGEPPEVKILLDFIESSERGVIK